MAHDDDDQTRGPVRPPGGGEGPTPEERVRRAARRRLDSARTIGTVGTIGLSFALAILVAALLGVWLDRVTGWSPWCTVVLFLIGFAAGVRNVYVMTKRFK